MAAGGSGSVVSPLPAGAVMHPALPAGSSSAGPSPSLPPDAAAGGGSGGGSVSRAQSHASSAPGHGAAGAPSPSPSPSPPPAAAAPGPGPGGSSLLWARSPCAYVVAFYDAFVNANDGTLAFVMEYMDGGSLEDIVSTGGVQRESVLANICVQVLKGLQFLHRNHIVHRDLKPSNLLINHAGDVKLTDFGIVRQLDGTLDMASTFVGTATYMAPERIAGEPYSYHSDVWSFGLSILAVALGRYPIDVPGGASYWSLLNYLQEEEAPLPPADRFSPAFRDFIAQCLQKDPERRPLPAALLEHPFLARAKTELETIEYEREAAWAAGIPYAPSQTRGGRPGGGSGGAAAAEPPPPPTEATLAEVKDIAKKVQKYRYWSALKRGERHLPLIPSYRIESLARQIGVDTAIVAGMFDRYHAALSRHLYAQYRERRRAERAMAQAQMEAHAQMQAEMQAQTEMAMLRGSGDHRDAAVPASHAVSQAAAFAPQAAPADGGSASGASGGSGGGLRTSLSFPDIAGSTGSAPSASAAHPGRTVSSSFNASGVTAGVTAGGSGAGLGGAAGTGAATAPAAVALPSCAGAAATPAHHPHSGAAAAPTPTPGPTLPRVHDATAE